MFWSSGSSGSISKLRTASVTEMTRQQQVHVTSAALGALHGSDIVKTGYLHIKRPPSNQSVKIRIKAWQKRFFVLRDESFHDGTTMLEMFNSYSDWMQDPLNAEQYSVDLRNVTHVEEYRDSKRYPYAFVVTRSGRSPLVLGTECQLEMKEWLVAIKLLSDKMKNREPLPKVAERRPSCPSFLHLSTTPQNARKNTSVSSMDVPLIAGLPVPQPRKGSPMSATRKSTSPPTAPRSGLVSSNPEAFPVKIEPTESSERNSLQGDFLLSVDTSEVTLRHPVTSRDAIRWPLVHIKKFKSETVGTGLDQITLDASNNSGKSAGCYVFTTLYGQEIINRVRAANRKVGSDMTSRQLECQMERLKNALSIPVPARMERAPSAPCLNQDFLVSRQAMPLPPVPNSTPLQKSRQNHLSVSSSESSASSGSSTGDILEQHVNVNERPISMGPGYLELLEDVGSPPLSDGAVGGTCCLDDFVTANEAVNTMFSDETHIRQDSGFIDTIETIKVQRVMQSEVESIPPPLPPRTHRKEGRASPSPSPSPSQRTPPTLQEESVVTHL